jgi:hypothetical protein
MFHSKIRHVSQMLNLTYQTLFAPKKYKKWKFDKRDGIEFLKGNLPVLSRLSCIPFTKINGILLSLLLETA